MTSSMNSNAGTRNKKSSPQALTLCELYSSRKRPHHAVCSVVLNLLSQDGLLSISSALAEAYRVTGADVKPCKTFVGSKPVFAASRTQQGTFFIPRFITAG